MVPDPRLAARPGRRFDDHEVDPNRQAGHGHPAGQLSDFEESHCCSPEMPPLAVVEGLLGQAEFPGAARANLDQDQCARRAGIV